MIRYNLNQDSLTTDESLDFDASINLDNITDLTFDTKISSNQAKVREVLQLDDNSIIIHLSFPGIKILINSNIMMLQTPTAIKGINYIRIDLANGNLIRLYDDEDENNILSKTQKMKDVIALPQPQMSVEWQKLEKLTYV
jgi:hypothetical protein